MFEPYKDVFNKRGASYQEAMERCPDARKREFELVVDRVEWQPGMTVLDIPSGGGYLKKYLPADPSIRLISAETSDVFHALFSAKGSTASLLCPMHDLPLDANAVDAIVSVAGLHHAERRADVFGEWRRVLRPAGRLCIADVRSGSNVDHFLNGFVNRFNSSGHQGAFIDAAFVNDLAASGWSIDSQTTERFAWLFPDTETMVMFCTLLFGLDRACPADILAGITDTVGFHTHAAGVSMHWELVYLTAHATKISTI